ncbi:MAG: bifunctional [glutamine synthetase] adenylyltransferase/[glutamine synthetase]-adenylyl-L-tyrosine phosphorylase [Nocardiaceae bacterium]|nr:bifunctional [glutamine synthetase] adenylyltransferase/[glutamine synthetase]-adenylyl-L-tyrosine phosphorylase [Nocardiaceae bacterium]
MTRPPTSRSVVPSPARLGLLGSTAGADLEALGWMREPYVPVLWALSRAPDADLALRTLADLRSKLGPAWQELDAAVRDDRALRGRLLALIGGSAAFADQLCFDPPSWKLLQRRELQVKDELLSEMLSAVGAKPETGPAASPVLFRATITGPDAVAALKKRYRELVMFLAALDLAATVENEPVIPFTKVAEQLSDLADVALTAALSVAVATLWPNDPCPVRLGVLAMGKCGGRELNYISDVDVVFVAEPNGPQAARLAAEMMRIGSSAYFEVDAALRPEGKQGELTRTLDSHVAYYKRWAKTWEFQALLKARPMTGDIDLATRYCDALLPMVWLASERADFVVDVQAMRRRVEESIPAGLQERELKLGRGGLRDVEFAVQLLQLVHGRTDASLRVTSTVAALTALAQGGYIGRDDAANMTASYEFLRLLEHRLQLQKMRRTHLLPEPDNHEAFRWLARAAHMRPDGRHDAEGVLKAEIKRNAHRVRRLHSKLFYRPLLESVTRMDRDALTLTPEAAVRQLAVLGYTSPQNALGHLRALTSGVSRKGRIQAVLLPQLLEWLGETPDPDAGLLAYRRLCEEHDDLNWFLRELRDEGAVAHRLMTLLGTSGYLPDLLMKAPDVIRLYGDGPSGPLLTGTGPDEVARGIAAATARYNDPARAVAAARSLRRHELARVASADLLGLLDLRQVCQALSSVWVAVLAASMDAVIAAWKAENKASPPARLAVIGMGRLGGAELGYGSDADVMFVCEPVEGVEEAVAVKWAGTVAETVQRLLGAPSMDPPLQVDTALRPEGRGGPPVRTLASYEAYYAQWVQAWEVQALLRAHAVCGDPDLGQRFLRVIDRYRYPEGGISADAIREIRRIKARVDSERLPRGADPSTHTKLGRGGLADVEWTVQLLQLKFAHEYPALHNTSTLQTLTVAAELELITAEDATQLRDAWLTATRARNALVLVKGKPTDQLPGPGRVLTAVARAAGWTGDAGSFLDNYLRVTRRARSVVERVFGA